jgi:ADP-heptose:LPS heptosyltransferase
MTDAPVAKIRPFVSHYTMGRGVDVGCGSDKIWPASIGVDRLRVNGKKIADVESDAADLSMFADESLFYVFSSHLLQNVQQVDWEACLAEWWRVLKTEGYLVLWLSPDGPGPKDIGRAIRAVAPGGAMLVEDERRGDGHFQVYQKRSDGAFLADPWEKPAKNCLVIRYGGFGDMIWASSLFPVLKSEGWHVTVNTTPAKMKVLEHDPHIDDFWLQESDQVPNAMLGDYWTGMATRYDRVINLSESVENILLAKPTQVLGRIPAASRRAMFGDQNYVEWTHKWAGVPGPFNPRFYATESELEWAREFRAGLRGKVVLWALTGSAAHKIYPRVAEVIAQLQRRGEYTVILSGAENDREFETAIVDVVGRYSDASCLVPACGKWSIRETFAMAQVADAVVGPETGVLNAVGMEDNLKVVFLSHSSEANLTRDWRNTVSLSCEPPDHMLHYGWETLRKDPETGAASSALIPAHEVVDAIVDGLRERPVMVEVLEAAE